MSDNPTVERAYQVMRACQQTNWGRAEALAAAGLLADPTTPTLTDLRAAGYRAALRIEAAASDFRAAVDRLATTTGVCDCPRGDSSHPHAVHSTSCATKRAATTGHESDQSRYASECEHCETDGTMHMWDCPNHPRLAATTGDET